MKIPKNKYKNETVHARRQRYLKCVDRLANGMQKRNARSRCYDIVYRR